MVWKTVWKLNTKPKTSSSALYQYLASFTGTLGVLTTGMHYAWPSPSLPILLAANSSIPISSSEGSWLAVMPLLGAITGSSIGACTLNRFGRKNSILVTAIPFTVAWLMVAFATNVHCIISGRFLAGIADGWTFTAVPIYLSEIAEPRIRGRLGSLISVVMITGMLLINVIGSVCDIKTAALISSVVPVLLLVTFPFMPESPYQLLLDGDMPAARAAMQLLRGRTEVDAELKEIVESLTESLSRRGRPIDLFTDKTNRRSLLIMVGLRTAQQWSGVTAFTFYTKMIFEQAGGGLPSSVSAIAYTLVQVVMSTVSSIIIDRTGRRPLLIVSSIGSGLTLFIAGTYFFLRDESPIDTSDFDWVPVTALILFIVIYSLGFGTIPVLMLGELFAVEVKPFALCFMDCYFALCVTFISKFFQITMDEYGVHFPFLVFTAFCAGGAVFIYFVVPETKAKTLDEIQKELRMGKKSAEKAARIDTSV